MIKPTNYILTPIPAPISIGAPQNHALQQQEPVQPRTPMPPATAVKRPKNLKRWLTILIPIMFVIAFAYWYQFVRNPIDQNGLPATVSYEFIKAKPEATLYYPGATKLRTIGGGQESTLLGGTNSAFAGAVMYTDDSEEEVYAWYDEWLREHGWQYDPRDFGLVTTEISTKAYLRGNREIFNVSMNDKDSLQRTIGQKVPQDKTVFEYSYSIRPPRKTQ